MRTSPESPERPQIPVLVFHKVDPRFEWGITRVYPAQFRTVLHSLKALGYETVSIHSALDSTDRLPEKPVVITFDDSYASIFQYALPILQELQYTATIFVITGFAGTLNEWDVNLGGIRFRHLSWKEIRHLSNIGFEIGSHTVHHPDLTRVSVNQARKELIESKDRLEHEINKPVSLISFPFGRYNDTVIQICKETGYQHGCGFWTQKKYQPFVFERKAYYLFDNRWTLHAKLNHHWARPLEELKLRLVNFCSHGTSLVKPAKLNRYHH